MSSGVPASDECVTVFQDLKLRKKSKYIIYNLNQGLTEIVVQKASKEGDFETFVADLPASECRWAVYDFEYDVGSEGKRNKICFISWSPDDAKVRQKMVFASSREALKRKLDGIAIEIQGTSFDEVTYETILAKANRSR
ncbi:hypothetical protein V8E55_009516 [Tylopilus felleus]|jgi:cofilin